MNRTTLALAAVLLASPAAAVTSTEVAVNYWMGNSVHSDLGRKRPLGMLSDHTLRSDDGGHFWFTSEDDLHPFVSLGYPFFHNPQREFFQFPANNKGSIAGTMSIYREYRTPVPVQPPVVAPPIIPLPASVLMLLGALAGLGLLRRRKG